MIELFVADTDATSGSIAVSWCVSPETLKLMEDHEVIDPQLVIIVSPEGEKYKIQKEWRTVVSLKDLMTYVEFRVPGKNRISAIVSFKSRKHAKDRYLSRDSGSYQTDVLEYDGNDYSYWLKTADKNHTLAEPLMVNVPQECFAPEPSATEKEWVNHFFRNKAVDQCDFRRRRMFAYTVQPVLFALFMVPKLLLTLLSLLTGCKNFSLKYLLHPLTYTFRDALNLIDLPIVGSIFIRALPEDNDVGVPSNMVWYLVRKLCFLPFMPMVFIPLALFAWFHCASLLLAIAMIAGVLMITFIIMSVIDTKVLTRIYHRIESWLPQASEPTPWYLDEQEANLVMCSGRPKPTSIKNLPAKKRTLSLRFHDLKSKVCRPFSA